MSDPIHDSGETTVLAALALELAPGDPVARDRLAQDAAGRLAMRVAMDLAGFNDEAASLDLVLVGAHYDPVELLRPGWPLYRGLVELAAAAPRDAVAGGGSQVIAFGAHDEQLPGNLAPSPDYTGGPLRLLPFVLQGDAGVTGRVRDAFERDLVETGMAGAETALLAQDLFGMRVEHARYLTLHDLLAMTAMQYEHSGLAPLWPLLEAALLAPSQEAWTDGPREPLAHYADGAARIAMFSPAAWQARHAPDERDEARLRRGFDLFQARQRQFAAVLEAHGVPVTFAHCNASETPDV